VSLAVLAAGGLAAGLALANPFARPPSMADLTGSTPAFYQVVYRVEQAQGDQMQTSFEVLTFNGPFNVSDLTYTRPPSSGAPPTTGSVSTFSAQYELESGRLKETSPQGPALGGGAQALGVELSDLVARHLAIPLDTTMVVAERRCEVVRFSGPPAGPITPFGGADHDDLCIDSSGLVLSEAWTYKGRVIRRKTALEVSLAPGALHVVGPPPVSSAVPLPPADEVVGVVTAPKEKSFLTPPIPPPGFSSDPEVGVAQADPLNPMLAENSYLEWAFSRGGDLVTVDAGTGAKPWTAGDTPARPLKLAGLGQAQSALTSNGPEIRIALSDNRWVLVDGTIPLAELASYASGLHLASGS
jgi:hypothetical protein